jgi:hypothetical protein
MDDGGPRVRGLDCRVGDLLRRDRHEPAGGGRVSHTGDGTSDEYIRVHGRLLGEMGRLTTLSQVCKIVDNL